MEQYTNMYNLILIETLVLIPINNTPLGAETQ